MIDDDDLTVYASGGMMDVCCLDAPGENDGNVCGGCLVVFDLRENGCRGMGGYGGLLLGHHGLHHDDAGDVREVGDDVNADALSGCGYFHPIVRVAKSHCCLRVCWTQLRSTQWLIP